MANPPKNERMFDLRVVDRYVVSGRLERAEYTAHLETLDDVAENVRPRDEGGDEDGYDRPIAAANEPRRLPLSALFVRPARVDDGDDDDDDFEDDEDDDDKPDDAEGGDRAAEAEGPVEAEKPVEGEKAVDDESAEPGDAEG